MERHGEYVAVWGATARHGTGRLLFWRGPPAQVARGVGPGLTGYPKTHGGSGQASNRPLTGPGIPRRVGSRAWPLTGSTGPASQGARGMGQASSGQVYECERAR